MQQDQIVLHHMLADSLANVVAEEAAKCLLLDVNLEHRPRRAERTIFFVTKRLALVQADIWAKREVAGDIYELDEWLEPAEVSTLSSLEKLVGEIADTEHLFVRHRSGLRCQAYNLYSARVYFSMFCYTAHCGSRAGRAQVKCCVPLKVHHRHSTMPSLPVSRAFSTPSSCTSHSPRSTTTPSWMPSPVPCGTVARNEECGTIVTENTSHRF